MVSAKGNVSKKGAPKASRQRKSAFSNASFKKTMKSHKRAAMRSVFGDVNRKKRRTLLKRDAFLKKNEDIFRRKSRVRKHSEELKALQGVVMRKAVEKGNVPIPLPRDIVHNIAKYLSR